MCTAFSSPPYFGRTLDHHQSFSEQIALCPQNAPLSFRALPAMERHFAFWGMASEQEGVPLYYDAFNETGLFMAGLLFSESACYLPPKEGAYNVAPFELIPWILGQCPTLSSALALLPRVHLWNEAFSPSLPLSPLHWLIADEKGSAVLEPSPSGLKIYPNPVGVLTNEPPFPYQLFRLRDFLGLSPQNPPDRFTKEEILSPYSRGMGALGLPGDWSSSSRFVRGAFAKEHLCIESPLDFFDLLNTVWVPKGVSRTAKGEPIFTLYGCCCDVRGQKYYYKTPKDPVPVSIDLKKEGRAPLFYPL